jgi:hypothetical protein
MYNQSKCRVLFLPYSYVNTGVQTAGKYTDYKKLYKSMVEKVRNNELMNLDLKNDNIRLSVFILLLLFQSK